jgi:hypothetical protein
MQVCQKNSEAVAFWIKHDASAYEQSLDRADDLVAAAAHRYATTPFLVAGAARGPGPLAPFRESELATPTKRRGIMAPVAAGVHPSFSGMATGSAAGASERGHYNTITATIKRGGAGTV